MTPFFSCCIYTVCLFRRLGILALKNKSSDTKNGNIRVIRIYDTRVVWLINNVNLGCIKNADGQFLSCQFWRVFKTVI